MNVRAIEAAAGMGPGLVNVWISRGYVPGVGVGTDRRPRDFDLRTAIHVGLMAELVRLRVAPELAAAAAMSANNNKVLLLRPHPAESDRSPDPEAPGWPPPRSYLRQQPIVLFFKDPENLDAYLKKPGGPPTTFSVVHIWKVEERMRRAEAEWLARHDAGNRPKGPARRRSPGRPSSDERPQHEAEPE
jgi:hypothetical protein